MSYVNVGVEAPFNKSKKALKDAVKADPASVEVYGTSPMGPQFNGPVTNMPNDVKLSVCGPDPFTARNWYATIERKNGKIVCT